jgi:hypothetical protein
VRKSRGSRAERSASADEEDRKYGRDITPTGTRCPDPDCGESQWFCPGGVTCDNGHGESDPSDIPIEREDHEPKPTCKTRRNPERPSGDEPSQLLASLDMGDLGSLVERIFDVDFDVDYERVVKSLKFGDATRAETKTLRKALDDQTDVARVAHRLYCNAREAREVFEIDALVVLSSMRNDATHVLQTEKKKGDRTKAITDADVEAMMASRYPDVYRDLARRRKRVELLCKHLEELADIAKKRINTLDTITNADR